MMFSDMHFMTIPGLGGFLTPPWSALTFIENKLLFHVRRETRHMHAFGMLILYPPLSENWTLSFSCFHGHRIFLDDSFAQSLRKHAHGKTGWWFGLMVPIFCFAQDFSLTDDNLPNWYVRQTLHSDTVRKTICDIKYEGAGTIRGRGKVGVGGERSGGTTGRKERWKFEMDERRENGGGEGTGGGEKGRNIGESPLSNPWNISNSQQS